MSKSFCNGCKHWQKIEGCKEVHEYFYACMKFVDAYNLKTRKELCNGKYKENQVMNAKDFFILVSEMRKTQKEYFKTRSQTVLQQSKDLEKQVDKEIDRVNKLTTEPELNFGG